MSLNNFLKEHIDVVGGTLGGIGIQAIISESVIIHLENIVWSVVGAVSIFFVLHFIKKLTKWKD